MEEIIVPEIIVPEIIVPEIIVPEIVFIVPYRDREAQLSIFLSHMPNILKGLNYEIYISHQKDKRFFNRGAMKNIGFMHVKEKYPDNYKDINFVFNDIDTLISRKGLTNFKTVKGKVKHIFGFKRAFGGIFSIKGEDFENLNGFPSIWNWGMEDNALKYRWLNKMKKNGDNMIDYSEFFDMKSKDIVLLWHGDKKVFNKHQTWNAYENSIDFKDGINKIRNIQKTENTIEDNFFMINTTYFIPATLPPKNAEVKEIKSIRDVHFGYDKKKSEALKKSRHYQIRNNFSLLMKK